MCEIAFAGHIRNARGAGTLFAVLKLLGAAHARQTRQPDLATNLGAAHHVVLVWQALQHLPEVHLRARDAEHGGLNERQVARAGDQVQAEPIEVFGKALIIEHPLNGPIHPGFLNDQPGRQVRLRLEVNQEDAQVRAGQPVPDGAGDAGLPGWHG